MKANQKGFSVIEILIVLVMAGLIGAVGWLVYDRQKNKTDNKDTNTPSTQQAEVQEQKEATVTVDYSQWTRVTDEELTEYETASYKTKGGTGTLKVFSKEPVIRYSSNAPVYCKYEGGKWVHYSAIESATNTYQKDESSGACNSIKETDISGFTAHTRYGGALGQTTFTAVIENETEWFAFKDYKNHDNENITEAEAKAIENELLKSIQNLVAKTLTKE
jgi:prepilin-type N-terminal cleavage/methylation domain-containing protein